MDIAWFLKERTEFIRQFYDTAAKSFEDTLIAIKNELPPYDEHPDPESGEPAFQLEWSHCQNSLELVGRTCVSLLSDSIKLFLLTWEKNLFIEPQICQKQCATTFKNSGFLYGYLECFNRHCDLRLNQCSARLDVIEQIVLARNSAQHGSNITSLRVVHDGKTLNRHPKPFFASAQEMELMSDNTSNGMFSSLLKPSLEITREKLFEAIHHTEILADWVEDRLVEFRYSTLRPTDCP